MPSNSGKPLDSAGNLQVDFVWGNFAPQPNDVRTVASDTNVSTSAATAADLVDITKKRIVPGRDNHDNTLAGYGGYPSFEPNNDGAYTIATTIGGTTGNAQYTFNTLINVPKVDGLTDVNAKDALRDNGSTGTITASTVAGGRVVVIGASRATTVVTINATAHGFLAGDVVAIYGLTAAGVLDFNGVWTVLASGLTADAFTFTHTASGTVTGATSGYTACAVVVSKSVATTVNGALAAGVSTLVATSTTAVTVGMLVTGAGIASGTVVQYLNGTSVGLSLPTTAAIANGASVTFATVATPAVAARTVAFAASSATAGTATVNTVAAHGLAVGDSVSLVNSTVLAATTGVVASAATALVVADATNIAASAVVTGPGIAAGTTVSGSPTGTAVTLNGNSTAALVAQSVVTTGTATTGSTALTIPTGSALPTGVTTNGSTASGSSTITVTGTVTAAAGRVVQANGGSIPAGTTVLSVAGQVLTLSQATTATIAGSTALYFSNSNLASSTADGHLVTGVGIPENTYVSSGGGTVNIVLSNATTLALSGTPVTFSLAKTASGTAGSTSLTVANNTALVVGQTVVGAGIPDGTIITAISGTTLTLSQALFGTFSSKLVTFRNLLTFGTAGTSKLNSPISTNLITAVQVTAVPSTTSFQFERTGLTGAATFAAASDNFVATSASSTSGGYTLNVATGVASMVNCIVTGAGIPDGTFVTSRSTNALTISKALTADPGTTPLVFYPASVVEGARTNTAVIGSQNISGAQLGTATVTYNIYN